MGALLSSGSPRLGRGRALWGTLALAAGFCATIAGFSLLLCSSNGCPALADLAARVSPPAVGSGGAGGSAAQTARMDSGSSTAGRDQLLLIGYHNTRTSFTARLVNLMGAWIGEEADIHMGESNKLK